jgi:hypothetical protein
MSVTGERFEIHTAGGNLLKGKLQLDLRSSPHKMDLLHDNGLHWEAVYEPDREGLKLNYVAAGGRDSRPSSFRTSPETEATLVILKRGGNWGSCGPQSSGCAG